jgi:hypothetical protein
MERKTRKRKPAPATPVLGELHHSLIALYDEITETAAWTAFFVDGICGVLADRSGEVDPQVQTGLRFASIWLKQRNKKHAATLRLACDRLRSIRATGHSRKCT